MSSLLSKIGHFLGLAAHAAEKIVVSIGKAEVHVALTSPFGIAILNALKAGEAGTTNAEKYMLAAESLTSYVVAEIANPDQLKPDIDTTVKMVIEAALPQIKDAVTTPITLLEHLAAKQ